MKTQSYKDRVVWQKGIALAKIIYRLTQNLPPEEKFGLVAQMRRAAVSIPSNVAEGQARHTTGEFIQGVSHAEGSTAELDTQLFIALQLGFCTESSADPSVGPVAEVRRMLNALRRKLDERRYLCLTRHSSLVTRHSERETRMIPLRISLGGFLCYREPKEIAFDEDAPLWMLAGLNGSGKSAVFDAV